MAGIPWGKYDKGDWVRIPGKERRYKNVQNPNITISRRQFDEHYGSAAEFGTYERKAKASAGTPAQLLRPARGRKSARKLTPAEQEAEINRRKVAKQESAKEKLAKKLATKKNKVPQKITLKNFQRGKVIRRIRVDLNQEEVEKLRQAAQKSKIVFGYWVGLEMVSERDGKIKTPALFTQRDIYLPFTELDFQNAIQFAMQKSYAELTGMWIAFHLTAPAAKRNGVKK